MTEVRNVLWPAYETPEYDAAQFLQGIAGTLELFHRSTLAFQDPPPHYSARPSNCAADPPPPSVGGHGSDRVGAQRAPSTCRSARSDRVTNP